MRWARFRRLVALGFSAFSAGFCIAAVAHALHLDAVDERVVVLLIIGWVASIQSTVLCMDDAPRVDGGGA